MRFIKDGPDIPDELLLAQDEGNVVFFCGAGVSRAFAGLSDFAGLAESVMQDLGSMEESRETQQFSTIVKLNKDKNTRGLVSADHIFTSLRRSFDYDDVGRSVAKNLKTQAPDLSAHKIILKLARLQSGQTRLITTNFDLLFEKCDSRLESKTRSKLPRIEFSDNDWGVVHLHGKVLADYSAPDSDGFVLSSSEFGDAYLAQGWARDFVKAVLSKYTAVFIGYSADDPPIKYLLEGLQQSNGVKHKIYAFQSGPNDEAVAQWGEKGVEAIIYGLKEGKHSHEALWKTLNAWGDRSKDPIAWKKRLLSKASKGPVKLSSHERGMVSHLVKSSSGARAFSEMDPPMPSEWLCVFDRSIRLNQSKKGRSIHSGGVLINPHQMYYLDSDPPLSANNDEYAQDISDVWDAFTPTHEDYSEVGCGSLSSIRGVKINAASQPPPRLHYIARWIAKVADQRISVWWAGKQVGIHPMLLLSVDMNLKNLEAVSINAEIIRAWNTIFELSHFYSYDKRDGYELKFKIKVVGWSDFIVREYFRISEPFLKRGRSFENSIPRDNRRTIKARNLACVDVGYPEHVYNIEVPDEYLARVVNALRINLEKAIALENEYSLSMDSPILEVDESIAGQCLQRGLGFSGYVIYFSKLFKRLLQLDKAAAQKEYDKWDKDIPSFQSLRLWGASLDNFLAVETFFIEISSLTDDIFWSDRGQRDLLLALKRAWQRFNQNQRKAVEKRLLKGPSECEWHSKQQNKSNAGHSILTRFAWLDSQGCVLSFDFNALKERLIVDVPDWKLEHALMAADSIEARGGFITTNTDWSSLEGEPLSSIISKSDKIKGRNWEELTEYAPFKGVCDDAPLTAISALSLELKKKGFSSRYWEEYLLSDKRKSDSCRLKVLTGGRLCQIPDDKFIEVSYAASCWFEGAGPEIRDKSRGLFERVWDKFINVITQDSKASRSALIRQDREETDWTGEAINSVAGHLAELHMTDPTSKNLKENSGLPLVWLDRADQLLTLPEDAHRYVMVIFVFNLSWFHYWAPKWTEQRFLRIIEDDECDENDKNAVWAGFMWGAKTPNSDLFLKLKPHLLSAVYEHASERQRNLEVLSGILLSGWGSVDDNGKRYVTNEEMRNVLLGAGSSFRSYVLWHLERWSGDEENNWHSTVLEFLRDVWPKHKKVRTDKISAQLCDIALKQKDNFPEASDLIVQLVSKVINEYIDIPETREDNDNLVQEYPEAYLNLLYAILSDQPERWPYGASNVLKAIEKVDQKLLKNPKLIELKSRLNDL